MRASRWASQRVEPRSGCKILNKLTAIGMPDGETELEPGDYVDAPADERHYHGAAAGHDCTFLAITWGTTDWENLAP